MRRELNARQESHSRHTKPEEFSSKEKNDNPHQRAYSWNGVMHRIKRGLSSHGADVFAAKAEVTRKNANRSTSNHRTQNRIVSSGLCAVAPCHPAQNARSNRRV